MWIYHILFILIDNFNFFIFSVSTHRISLTFFLSGSVDDDKLPTQSLLKYNSWQDKPLTAETSTVQGLLEAQGLYLKGSSGYPILALFSVWGEKAAPIFL